MLATPQPSINQALWILDDNVLQMCKSAILFISGTLQEMSEKGEGVT
jgi:hypothetical protein